VFVSIILSFLYNCKAYGESNKIKYYDDRINLPFHEKLGGFYFITRDDYGDKELGYSISYRGENRITASIYVYDAGKYPIPEGINNSKIKIHFNQVAGDLRSFKKQGVYKEVVNTSFPELIKSSMERDFLLSAFNIEYSNKENIDIPPNWTSYILLRGYNGYYFKVRITYPDWPNKKRVEMDEDVRRFLNALRNIMKIK
jgi:hypothetical protein